MSHLLVLDLLFLNSKIMFQIIYALIHHLFSHPSCHLFRHQKNRMKNKLLEILIKLKFIQFELKIQISYYFINQNENNQKLLF